MLNVNIEYPIISLPIVHPAQKKINLNYITVANSFFNYAKKTLLPNAIEQYEASIKQNYPFHPYEAFMKYTVTLKDNCTISTYYDQYEYTGGAHGNTIRLSDTHNLQNGNIIKLKDLFKGNVNYNAIIIKEIIAQAHKNIIKEPGIYFDNYEKLIVENYKEEHFYLTPKTVDIYYQQYDIAPYSSGIIVFSIPYENLGIQSPHCTLKKPKSK